MRSTKHAASQQSRVTCLGLWLNKKTHTPSYGCPAFPARHFLPASVPTLPFFFFFVLYFFSIDVSSLPSINRTEEQLRTELADTDLQPLSGISSSLYWEPGLRTWKHTQPQHGREVTICVKRQASAGAWGLTIFKRMGEQSEVCREPPHPITLTALPHLLCVFYSGGLE